MRNGCRAAAAGWQIASLQRPIARRQAGGDVASAGGAFGESARPIRERNNACATGIDGGQLRAGGDPDTPWVRLAPLI